ncbi:MAG: GNAT family N-acetyltransferase [Anaerolineae bacterium]
MNQGNIFPVQTYRRGGFLISTNPDRLDLEVIHDFLANQAYWSPGITSEQVARFVQHSLCFGVYDIGHAAPRQIGFGRVITDFTTFAYLADVFILPDWRGQGVGQWLIQCILSHPELQGLRKWTLNTQDAHGLYQRFGFKINPHPEKHMVWRPRRAKQAGDQ